MCFPSYYDEYLMQSVMKCPVNYPVAIRVKYFANHHFEPEMHGLNLISAWRGAHIK